MVLRAEFYCIVMVACTSWHYLHKFYRIKKKESFCFGQFYGSIRWRSRGKLYSWPPYYISFWDYLRNINWICSKSPDLFKSTPDFENFIIKKDGMNPVIPQWQILLYTFCMMTVFKTWSWNFINGPYYVFYLASPLKKYQNYKIKP